MIRLIFVSLFGLSLAHIGVRNAFLTPTGQPHFNSWSKLHGLRDFQWSQYMFPTRPEENKSITEIEKQIDEHLKRAETTCESEYEDQGNKYFCSQYKNFLQNICSALDNIRNMVDERKIVCKSKEKELKDLHKLLADCARTRVKLLKERDIYKEAVKRAMKKSSYSNENNSFNVKEELSVNGTSNSTEENNMQEYTSEFNSSDHPETTVTETNNGPVDREMESNPADINDVTPKTYNILTVVRDDNIKKDKPKVYES